MYIWVLYFFSYGRFVILVWEFNKVHLGILSSPCGTSSLFTWNHYDFHMGVLYPSCGSSVKSTREFYVVHMRFAPSVDGVRDVPNVCDVWGVA